MPPAHSASSAAIAPERFSLTIDGVEIAAFSALVGILSEEPDDAIGALLKKLPGKRTPPTVTLRRGLTADLQVATWHDSVVNARAGDAKRNATLEMYDASGKPVARYHLENAWPSKVEVSALQAGSGEVLMETVTLACDRLQRVGV